MADAKTFEDLTTDSTPEDIDAVVEQLAEEAESDREGEESEATEEKSDAQVTSEHADIEDTDPDPTLSGSEDEKTGKNKASESDDWREDAIAEASAYGFSEEDVAEFKSREELDRALKLFDRQLKTERDKLGGDEEGEPVKPTEKPPKGDGEKAGSYEIRLSKDLYDDDLVDEFTGFRDYVDERLAAIEAHFEREAAFAEEERFDHTVDDLGFAELFGKTGEESKVELGRRQELLEHVRVEQAVLKTIGKQVDYNALVRRVARSLFADEYDKKLIKNHTRKISRQSNGRQGGGATRPTDPPEDPRDEADRLYKEMAQA